MPKPANERLYRYVKLLANKKFKSKSGVYRSSWIVREYKKRGGTYTLRKSSNSGLNRWYKEQWIDLNRPIKDTRGRIIGYHKCGRTSKNTNGTSKYPLCRPSKRVSKHTPRTVSELSKNSISKAKRLKGKLRECGNIKFGGSTLGREQYHGKKSSVMVKVPTNVKKWAMYAFKLKKLGFRGATKTGWKRARQLYSKEYIPIEDLRYMRNWFARHIVTSYPGYKKWKLANRPKDKTWHRKRAILSWITWGGTPAYKWINTQRIINKLNRHFNTDYKMLTTKVI
jgi:hypothetical protein